MAAYKVTDFLTDVGSLVTVLAAMKLTLKPWIAPIIPQFILLMFISYLVIISKAQCFIRFRSGSQGTI